VKSLIKIGILVLMCLVVAAAGCTEFISNTNDTNDSTDNSNVDLTTFNSDEVTFQYPSNWEENATDMASGDYIASLMEPFATIGVSVYPSFSSSSLDSAVSESKESRGNVIESQGSLTVNGKNAYEFVDTYNYNGENMKAKVVIVEKEVGTYYKVICYAPESEFDGLLSTFNDIINSFQIK